jgi:hypothetical protein
MDQVDRTHHTRRKQLTDMMNWCRHRRPHPGAAALASAVWTRPRNFLLGRVSPSQEKKLIFFALALALALAFGLVRKCSFDAGLKASASATARVKKIKQLKSRSSCACACACAYLVTQTPYCSGTHTAFAVAFQSFKHAEI